MDDRITVYNEYQQPWHIYPDDPLYEEALKESKTNEKIIWPLFKLVENRGYGWWSSFKKLDDFIIELENIVPNPAKFRLIDYNKEYTPQELRDLLQRFGSYLSSLYPVESRLKAENHALKEGFNTGMKVAMARLDKPSKTVKDAEANVLSNNLLFKDTKRMQIDSESMEILVHGWIEAFESAYNTISRLITLALGEAEHMSSRLP